ncbi:unnamed protein product [Polarella glacialis]|uniref:Uncharacterized protein n=1 Tax=Polarella glacialis TaxID=89957 RepID=A0A813H4A6_POLGL|nr:unnamed protein product [Polarella glacialis]
MSLAVCIPKVILGNPLNNNKINNNNNNKTKNKTMNKTKNKIKTRTKNSNKNKNNNKKYPLQHKATSLLTLAQDLSYTSTTVQIDLRASVYKSLMSCMLYKA